MKSVAQYLDALQNAAFAVPLMLPTGSYVEPPVSQKEVKREVYIANADGSGLRNLTNNPATDRPNWWLKDGDIIFSSDRSGNWEIYRMKPDGTGVKNLTNHPDYDGFGELTLDETMLYYVSIRDGDMGVYRMRPDGSEQHVVTNMSGPDSAPSPSPDGSLVTFQWRVNEKWDYRDTFVCRPDGTDLRLISDKPSNYFTPFWSPDSKAVLVLTFEANHPDGFPAIHRMGVHGEGRTALTAPYGPISDRVVVNDHAFTDDRHSFAFVAVSPAGDREHWQYDHHLGVMDSDGKNGRIITKVGGVREPRWSHDNRKIMFFRRIPGDMPIDEMYLVDLKSGQERSLGRLSEAQGFTFYPDDQSIIVGSTGGKTPFTTYDLYRVAADGSGIVKLTDGTGIYGFWSWSPGGNQMLLSREEGVRTEPPPPMK